jgi:hypothetical protein
MRGADASYVRTVMMRWAWITVVVLGACSQAAESETDSPKRCEQFADRELACSKPGISAKLHRERWVEERARCENVVVREYPTPDESRTRSYVDCVMTARDCTESQRCRRL